MGAWNPAKVFPEVLMPICGTIATYVINPIINDYIGSITIITAMVVSLSIVIYLCSFINFIRKKIDLSLFGSIGVGIIFFLVHFLLFIVEESNNDYMFLAHNVNCYYNYLIPHLLNISFVFWFLSKDNKNYSFSKNNYLKNGLLLLFIYICIFSNLYTNIILGVYAGVELLCNLYNDRKKINIKEFIRKNIILLLILLGWVICAIFELSGGRAVMASNGSSFANLLVKCLLYLKKMIFNGMNRGLLITFILILLVFCFVLWKNKGDNKLLFIKFILYIIIIGIYYILLSAKVKPIYIYGAEKICGLYIYCLSFVFLCFAYIVKKYPKISIILPVIICYFIVDVNGNLKNLKESNTPNISPITCKEIDYDIISQVVDASKKGLYVVELHVPVSEKSDNWPHAVYLGSRLSNTLYRHNLIKEKIEISVVLDEEKNRKYNIK